MVCKSLYVHMPLLRSSFGLLQFDHYSTGGVAMPENGVDKWEMHHVS